MALLPGCALRSLLGTSSIFQEADVLCVNRNGCVVEINAIIFHKNQRTLQTVGSTVME